MVIHHILYWVHGASSLFLSTNWHPMYDKGKFMPATFASHGIFLVPNLGWIDKGVQAISLIHLDLERDPWPPG